MRKHFLLFVSCRRQAILTTAIKKILGVALVCLCFAAQAWAQDFEVANEGTLIKYTITATGDDPGDNTVAVAKKANQNGYSGSIVIPATVTYGGVDYDVTSIGESAFVNCNSLTSITIPNSVTSIGDLAFASSSLTSITIPDAVTYIGFRTFSYCSSLTSITIPNSVTTIGNSAFSWCSSLTAIIVGAENLNYVSEDGVLFNESKETIIQYPAGKAGNSYDIPNSVTSIGYYAFSICSSLTAITIPEGVSSIEYGTFQGCSSLASITIPNSVIFIGNEVFLGCSSLTAITVGDANPNYASVGGVLFNKSNTQIIQYPAGKAGSSYDIPEGVTSIGDHAFVNCSSLTAITIPNSVNSIGSIAFNSCDNLTSFEVKCETPPSVSVPGLGYVFPYSNCTLVVPVGKVEDYQVADPWKNFATITEKDATPLTVEPESLSFGAYETLAINVTVSAAEGWNVSKDADWLAISYPVAGEGWSFTVTATANPGAAREALITVSNSSTTKSIRASQSAASFDIGGLRYTALNSTTVSVSAVDNTLSGDITIPPTVEYQEVPYSVTSIGEFAFQHCNSLTSITIPDGVTSIGYGTFQHCSSLTAITIPASVTSIVGYAFGYCSNLATIEVEWDTPLNIYNDLAYNGDYARCTLVVPEGKVAAYRAAEVWKKFATITEKDAEPLLVVPDNLSFGAYEQLVTNVTVSAAEGLNVSEDADWLMISYPAEGADWTFTVTALPNQGAAREALITVANSSTTKSIRASQSAASFDIGGLRYTALNSTTVSVSAVDNTLSGDITIPPTVEYQEVPYSVTSIGEFAFQHCNSLTSITIPDGVTSIGYGTFQHCSSLTAITIPASVTSIVGYAFGYCSNLATIEVEWDTPLNIYNDLAYNGDYARCTLVVPEGKVAAYRVAEVWKKFATITEKGAEPLLVVPDNLSFGAYEQLVINVTVSAAEGLNVSEDADWLMISYPEAGAGWSFTVTATANPGAAREALITVSNSSTTKSIRVQQAGTSFELEEILYTALTDNTVAVTLKAYENGYSGDITIPSEVEYQDVTYSVTSIGNNAFYYCSSLTSITIPASVTSIWGAVFQGCSSLTAITVEDANPNYASVDGVLFNKSKTQIIQYPAGKAGAYTIPNSVTSIGLAFQGCSNLAAITIPNSVTSIGQLAFNGCSSLTAITIPASVTSIGWGAFFNCSSLATIEVNWGIPIAIADLVSEFNTYNCTLIVPAGKVDIYRAADVWKKFATIIETGDDAEPLTVEPGSLSFEAYGSQAINVTVTPAAAAWNVSKPADADWLKISYPAEGEDWSFTVTVDPNPGAAREAMITVSNSSTNWSIPALQSATSFEVDGILYTATTDNTVAVTAKDGGYTGEIVIPPTVTCEVNGATYSVTSIGSDAFEYCSSLTDITIPNSVTSIGFGAFHYCSSLTSITIPNSVTFIGYWAFDGCSSLTSFEVEWATPLYLDTKDYGYFENAQNCTLVVPVGTVQAYKDAQFWGYFGDIVEASLSVPTSISFGASSESQTVAVTSNVTWTVSTTDSWLTVTKGSGEFTATASANTSTSQRTATITVSGGGLSREISVTQTGAAPSEPETPEVPETPSEPEVPPTPPVVAPNGVSLDLSSVTMKTGDTQKLVASVSPATADNKSVTWTSSDAKVATVAGGVVTAVAPGTATITVTTAVGGYKATCTVTVTGSTTGIAKAAEGVAIRAEAGKLYVNSPAAETVYIYSFTGKLLYSATKASGLVIFDAPSEKMLIVRGTSGWTRKLIN